MGDDDKKARFDRIREQIRASARRVGQASLATGVLVLCVPSGGITDSTAEAEIDVLDYHQASASDRVSDMDRVATVPDMPIADFGDAFKDFSDSTLPT